MPEKYRLTELGQRLGHPLAVVSAAVQALRRLPENKHLLEEDILVKKRIPCVPESHVQPLTNFLEKYATIQTHGKEHDLAKSQINTLYRRAGKGDLSQHAIREGKTIFLTREAMQAAGFKPRKITRRPPRKITPKRLSPPDYEEKESFALNQSEFRNKIATKLGRKDFAKTRELIGKLIGESGGHDTKFAHALNSAVDAYNAEELHNLVLRTAQMSARLRRALLEAYAEKHASFRERAYVTEADPLKQATAHVINAYG